MSWNLVTSSLLPVDLSHDLGGSHHSRDTRRLCGLGVRCLVGCIRLVSSERVCELLGGEQGVVHGEEQCAGWVLLCFTTDGKR